MTSKVEGTPNCVAIFSGGLDSTTLVYKLIDEAHVPHLISFNYGQRHKVELQYAKATAQKLGLRHDIVDLTGITHLISNSALTSPDNVHFTQTGDEVMAPEIEVPEGHYAEDNMKKTVVPNRNMIMLSIAAGVAVNNSYEFMATGVHAGDHFVYPDCRPLFIEKVNEAVVYGNEGFGNVPVQVPFEGATNFVQAPFLNWSKADIAFEACILGVPFEETWSCYNGKGVHCGKCGTCVERLEAIAEAQGRLSSELITAGVGYDTTVYVDDKFWREAVKNK